MRRFSFFVFVLSLVAALGLGGPSGALPKRSTQPSIELIDAAVTGEKITYSTGMTYKFHAIFDQARLPVEYRGTVRTSDPQRVMNEYRANRKRITAEGIASIAKYMKRAHAVGNEPMDFKDVPGHKVRVHWRKSSASAAVKAVTVLTELETRIMPELAKAFSETLKDDTAVVGEGRLDNGGSPALDIYLVNGIPGEVPLLPGLQVPHGPAPTSSHLFVRDSLELYGKDSLLAVIAHELYHCYQSLYNTTDRNLWLHEGTATWFESHVYPKSNGEHAFYPAFLNNLYEPIYQESKENENKVYGTAAFFAYLFRELPISLRHTIYKNTESMNMQLAVDAAIPELPGSPTWKGWKRLWMGFLASVWNENPISMLKMDGYTRIPQDSSVVRHIVGAPSPEQHFPLRHPLPPLSGKYVHFTFNSDQARLVSVYDGLQYKLSKRKHEEGSYWHSELEAQPRKFPFAAMTVWGKIDGTWVPFSSNYGVIHLCRDTKKERVSELLVILGNAEPRESVFAMPHDEPPTVVVSNSGCHGWSGTVSQTDSTYGSNYESQIVFERDPRFNTASIQVYKLQSASVVWKLSKSIDECKYSGSGSWSLTPQSYGEKVHQIPVISFEFQHLSGRYHRSGTGTGRLPTAPVFKEECKGPSGRRTGNLPDGGCFFGAGSDTGDYAKLSADGTTLSGTLINGNTRESIRLTATREP